MKDFPLWLGAIALSSAIIGCRIMTKHQEPSHLQHKIEIDNRSMGITELNHWIASSHIAVVSDISTNRTAVFVRGVMKDAFNSVHGIPGKDTLLGKFTLHALEYCPPWKSPYGHVSSCHIDNRLGMYSLWFHADFIYGIHGRHPSDQAEFAGDYLDRYNSWGCVVAPHNHLESLVSTILDTKGFKHHRLPDLISSHRQRNSTTNIGTIFIDAYEASSGGGTRRLILPANVQIGDPVRVDAKLLVIDSSQWQNIHDIQKRHSMVDILITQSASVPNPQPRLVQDCIMTSAGEVYMEPHKSEYHWISSLNTGDLLTEVYYHPSHDYVSSQGIKLTTPEGEGWLPYQPPAGPLKCLGNYYWSVTSKAKVAQSSRRHSSNPSCQLSWLNQYLMAYPTSPSPNQQDMSQTVLNTEILDNTLRKMPLYGYLNCRISGGGQHRNCAMKHSCSVRWDRGAAADCQNMFQFLLRTSPHYQEQHQRKIDQFCGTSWR